MLGGLIRGGLFAHQPRQAPTTSWNAALRSRNSLVDLVNFEPALEHGGLRVPWRLRAGVEPGPLLEPVQNDELRGDEGRRRPLVHDAANAPTTHMKATSGEHVRNTGGK